MNRHTLWFQRLPSLLVFSLTFLLLSCGDSSTGTNSGGGNGNEEPPPEPTYANVQEIFNSSCSGSGCHVGERMSGVRLDSYENIINSEGDQYNERVVQPNNADESPLIDKISPGAPQFGVRMPQGGPYLSDEEINLIRNWINNGAEQ